MNTDLKILPMTGELQLVVNNDKTEVHAYLGHCRVATAEATGGLKWIVRSRYLSPRDQARLAERAAELCK